MQEREKLLEKLVSDGYLKTPRIIEAWKKINRKDFVPNPPVDGEKENAYLNQPLSIGFEQTISQPLMVAFMLELLEPKEGEKILDIGSGSGWQTALLREIVGETGHVIGIERIPELYIFGRKNIEKYFSQNETVRIIEGDGGTGYKEGAPYDKIIAAAEADEIPQKWKEQLKIGGRVVAPVHESIVVLNKVGSDQFTKKEFFGFRFVPLVTKKLLSRGSCVFK